MASNENLLKWALWYWKQGFSLVPARGKEALVKWGKYQKERPAYADIEQWWGKQFKGANIALITGPISNLLIVDMDSEEAEKTVTDVLPDAFVCPTVKSPHGKHFYFQHQDGFVSRAGYSEGLDIKTTGGMIIAPPSMNDQSSYRWIVSPASQPLAKMPDALFELLKVFILKSNNNSSSLLTNSEYIYTIGSTDNQRQRLTTNDNQIPKGVRDDVLFHICNCLVKGGMPYQEIEEILSLIGRYGCNPPFPSKEIPIKIKSAFERQKNTGRAWLDEIREYLLTTNGNVTTTDVQRVTTATTRNEKKIVNQCMLRLEKEGIVKRTGIRAGEYKIIIQEINELDWKNASAKSLEIVLPLGLHQAVRVMPGSVLCIAGVSNSGKTAFCMSTARANMKRFTTRYLTSEIGPDAFKERMEQKGEIHDIPIALIDIMDATSFDGLIQPDALNIVDYVEPPAGEYSKIAMQITDIQKQLKKGIAVVALQKKAQDEYGAGGQFVRNKPHLFMTLDIENYPVCKATIRKCKATNHGYRNPAGKSCEYKIDHDGITIVPYGNFDFERWDTEYDYDGEEVAQDNLL